MHIAHTSPYYSRRSPVLAHNVVATSQPLAAQAGLSVLGKGGNAVDAAIATAAVLTVVEPTGNGLGGDAFAILWDGKELHGLNASGRSPRGWTPERFAGRSSMPERGWESVTVPGGVSAWKQLSDRFGRLDFATLFEPAIHYAENGFIVSPIVAELWARGAEILSRQPGFAAHFMPGGKTPAAGALFRSADLAESLRLIAETGGEAFYTGPLAEKIAAFAAEHDAAMTMDDLAAHRNDWCGTISQGFAGGELHEIPPNGQGIAALMALGILEHLGIERCEVDSVEALHLQIEAMKLAFRDMWAFVADRDYMKDVNERDLLDDAYLAERARLVDPNRAQDFKAGAPKKGGTVYLTVGDENGMMVSFIQSNYSGFGSGVVVPGTGISLQNRGSDFSLKNGHQNEVGPSKRPFHTIIPGFMMKDGAPLMSFGVMGGPIQSQGHVQMVLRTQLWKQDPQVAIDAPRWRVTQGLEVALETGTKPDLVQGLRDRGHVIALESPDTAFGFGGAQIVHRIEEGYIAGSDSRKDGQAVGF